MLGIVLLQFSTSISLHMQEIIIFRIILWKISSFLLLLLFSTDKTTYSPQHRSTQKSKDFMPPVKNRQRHSTPSSQVWQMKVEIPPSERLSKVTMQPSKNQPGQSHRTPSSHQVWRKKVETQPSERQSKVKMQPSKKQSMVKKQPSKKPSKQQSKQNVPSYHIVWDGMSKQNLLLLFLIKSLLLRISNIVPTFALWCVLERMLCFNFGTMHCTCCDAICILESTMLRMSN